MPASPSSNSADRPIPTGLRALLERKIKFRRRELDQYVVSRRVDIFEKLTERIQEYLPESSQRPGRLKIFRATYREMVALAVEVSQRWPKMVWQSILETAESTALAPEYVGDLQQLLEGFTWKEASDAFTLELVAPERVQSAMEQVLGRYGLRECKVDAHFEHRRNLEVAGAMVAVQEAARRSKEYAILAIDEWSLSQASSNHSTIQVPPIDPAVSLSKDDKQVPSAGIGSPAWRKQLAKEAAHSRHNRPGGSRDKKKQIRRIWATGKYTSRDRCAEEECAALGMSYSAARKALINTPDP